MSARAETDKGSRDDFSENTKDQLAKRSGYICSYPDCKRMTVAGSDDRKSRLTVTGVAAHITAASKIGPRYDANMSPGERSSENNGIWVCQIHGKFVDDNPSKCSPKELRRWKSQHEKWVFDRVESGAELFNKGIHRVAFANVGVFPSEYDISLGRHNLLVGSSGSGKTTLCQIIAALSGEPHWMEFDSRFSFSANAFGRSFISATSQSEHSKVSVKLSAQLIEPVRAKPEKSGQRIHVEVNGCTSVDWPRSFFRVLHFENQFQRSRGDPRDLFRKALHYLSAVFHTDEALVIDSLRDELFATSIFGYRFHRKGRRGLEILVPDGRTFYLGHNNLSGSEQQMAFIDIALKFVLCAGADQNWLLIFDSGFFGRLDAKGKAQLFQKITRLTEPRIQTIFCLHSKEDVDTLKDIQHDKWVNACRFGNLTLHSFL